MTGGIQMSKWTEIRDNAVEALNADGVGKDIKVNVIYARYNTQ